MYCSYQNKSLPKYDKKKLFTTLTNSWQHSIYQKRITSQHYFLLSLKIKDYGTLYIAIRIRVYWLLLIRILMNNMLITQQKGTPCFAAKHLVSCYDTPWQNTVVLAGNYRFSSEASPFWGYRSLGEKIPRCHIRKPGRLIWWGILKFCCFPSTLSAALLRVSGRYVDMPLFNRQLKLFIRTMGPFGKLKQEIFHLKVSKFI